ncbi:MAG: YihY/virulence factor BrkB family protein [Bacteroidota bacterium]
MSIKTKAKDIWQITKETASAWMDADPFRQSAVVAYYAIFSMPALLVIVIALAGFVFGEEAVRGQIAGQIGSALGPETAKQVQEIIANASKGDTSLIATIISVITLILGCTGVFDQLQVSLNKIWQVQSIAKKKWLKTIKDRLFSFGIVISIGFLLLISLLITTLLAAFSALLKQYFPEFMLSIFELINFLISFGVITVLFALMFKVLPDTHIGWKNVWIGAIATAFLFILGKFALGIYFGKAQPGSAYGAAGSIVLIMLWVSYSCMIVFFGAEFTKQYLLHYGGKITPTKDAVLMTPPQPIDEKSLDKEDVEELRVKK